MEVSECCGANFYEPGYPDSDICSACGEHSGVLEPKDKDNVISPDEYAEDIDLQAFAQGRKSSHD